MTIRTLKPQNHPVVDFPVLVMPLNILLRLIRLFLQIFRELESTEEIPVHCLQQVFKNKVIGIEFLRISSINLL